MYTELQDKFAKIVQRAVLLKGVPLLYPLALMLPTDIYAHTLVSFEPTKEETPFVFTFVTEPPDGLAKLDLNTVMNTT